LLVLCRQGNLDLACTSSSIFDILMSAKQKENRGAYTSAATVEDTSMLRDRAATTTMHVEVTLDVPERKPAAVDRLRVATTSEEPTEVPKEAANVTMEMESEETVTGTATDMAAFLACNTSSRQDSPRDSFALPEVPSVPEGAAIKPSNIARPKELIRKWPSVMMELMNQNDDDEWQPVMERIRTHPHEILIQGKNGGQNALHAACVRYPPTPIVQAILQAEPEAALQQNFSGETPLHLASYSASEEVQDMLVRAAPAAVAAADQYGDCPLHFAARSGATYPLMERMLQAAPECVSMRNKRGVTPFWLLPRSYLEAETLEEIFEEDAEDYHDDWMLLALFLRYSYFGAGQPAPRERESGGLSYDWMVHAAAATPSCPRETLRFLCHLFPEQALRYNEKGYTPLLLAAQVPEMDEPDKWDENEDGFREHVEAADVTLVDGTAEALPTEAAAVENVDTEYLEQALQGDATEDADEESVVSMLLEWSPRSVVHVDSDGRLPLAHALVAGKSWKVVRQLIQACQRALVSRDSASGGLFMFQLAAMKSPELDTVYTITRSLPELVAMTRRCTRSPEGGDSPSKKRARLNSFGG
jgi:ankyrin repeat protein